MAQPEQVNLKYLAEIGQEITVRVTPRASRNSDDLAEDGSVLIYVTCVPEDGKANKAVTKALANALGLAPSRLDLRRGEKGRDKTYVVV
jgi:uncharacterized protein YggU (UPF0235/DUF167 family)